jgi:hypothetical protein
MSRTPSRIYRGVVKRGAVVLRDGCDLPDGTAVEIRAEADKRGTPGAVLEAAKSPPHVEASAVDELMRKIEEGRRPMRFESPLD